MNRLVEPLQALPRAAKRLLVVTVDAALCVFTVWAALSLRYETWVALSATYLWLVLIAVLLAWSIFAAFGLYRAIFRYTGWNAMLVVARAVGMYGLLFAAVFTAIGVPDVPRTVGVLQPILLFFFVGGSRVMARYWLGGTDSAVSPVARRPGVLIYGAGSAGRQLAAAMAPAQEQRLLGFLDDDDRLHGHSLDGHPIFDPVQLADLVARLRVTDVLLAIPSAGLQRRREILESLRGHPVYVRTLPGLAALASGKVTVSDLRELDIEDLLGRDPVAPNSILLNRNLRGKVVMVTGAGGSIGSELCRQIVECAPIRLLLVDNSEYALYRIHQELATVPGAGKARRGSAVELIPLLASVQDEARMSEIMAAWRPHTVCHTAAYKHVPLVEHNPVEGVRNNVWGTWVCARAAINHGVQNFLLVSTDKAVRPTNIMGASKRLAEMVLQALSTRDRRSTDSVTKSTASAAADGPRFAIVRFGNVLGSSGSVVPLFREQIKRGGPITLTHPDVTRYFMTVSEAAQLVIQAGAMASGGDVFVLDMGRPVRIGDLAARMIELSGLTVRDDRHPDGDIEIQVTGMRPGEKLYEELLIGDNPLPTQHPRIKRAQEDSLSWDILQERLAALELALSASDIAGIRALLQQVVAGYEPAAEVVDWVHMARELEG